MTYTFQPQFIKRDSAVPIRMIAGGWIVGLLAIVAERPVSNFVIAVMGITLLGGGLLALSHRGDRMWRMLLGGTAGALTTWLGFQFAFVDRLLPVRDTPRDALDLSFLTAVVLGLAVLAIGIGGILEAVRAQAAPGNSPVVVRVYMIALGMAIAGAICATAGLSTRVTVVVLLAIASVLGALAWLRRQRPASDFTPTP